ncbi:MAG TPA: hypothetical protein VGQ59_21045 [Cyclobacteriaceae bacterium]|nr:hypothetical protein [Cyclobacteriaceae bacterium]
MKIISLLFLVILCGRTYSQQQTNRNMVQMTALEKATSQKKFGRGLTIVGGVLFSVGVAVGLNSTETITTTNGTSQTSETGNPGLAKACLLTGIVGLGVGIPLWSVGRHREKKLKRSQGVAITFSPQVSGLSLRLTF